METNKDVETTLRAKMALDELNLKEPDRLLILKARKKIIERKNLVPETNDFFSLVAAFLNFKIKLYQAVLATVVVGGLILIFNREGSDNRVEQPGDYISNIASVRSSTVLSSIYTFGLNKKPL